MTGAFKRYAVGEPCVSEVCSQDLQFCIRLFVHPDHLILILGSTTTSTKVVWENRVDAPGNSDGIHPPRGPSVVGG